MTSPVTPDEAREARITAREPADVWPGESVRAALARHVMKSGFVRSRDGLMPDAAWSEADAILDIVRTASSSLSEAWEAAEAALPEGWYLVGVFRDGNDTAFRWQADANGPTREDSDYGEGRTPADALRNLANGLYT